MKTKVFLLIVLALMAGGCLEVLQGEKVAVMYVKVTMGEEVNGTMAIQAVEAYADEMPKLQAPVEQYPEKVPAVYVDIVQNASKLSYQAGKVYTGPGVYSYVIGFRKEFSRSLPLAVMVITIDKNQEYIETTGMRFNWSKETQSKTFK